MGFSGVVVLDGNGETVEKIPVLPLDIESGLASSILYTGIMNLYQEYHLAEGSNQYECVEGALFSSRLDPGWYAPIFHDYIKALNLGAKPLINVPLDEGEAYYVEVSSDGEIELVFLLPPDPDDMRAICNYIQTQKVFPDLRMSQTLFRVSKIKVVYFY
jgi:hypothetical protein